MEPQRGGRGYWFLFVMTSSVWKKPVPASIISRWLSPNPSVPQRTLESNNNTGDLLHPPTPAFPSDSWSIISRTLGFSHDNVAVALASPHWVMKGVFVLREQFKCRAVEKAVPAHDQQIYILIFFFFENMTDCRTALTHMDTLKHESHPSNIKLYNKFIPHLFSPVICL